MKNAKGISLIALIITIIVIIILAAIVIGGAFNTPSQAKFSRWCNDISSIQDAITTAHGSRMAQVATDATSDRIDNSKIYKWIATGNEEATTEEIRTRKMVKIDKDNNKLNMALPEYANQDWYIDVSSGEVYMSPGLTNDECTYMCQEDISIPKYSIVRYAKVGDYVVYNADSKSYTPTEALTGNTSNTEQKTVNRENSQDKKTDCIWRVWENDGKTVKLVHVEPLNSLTLGKRNNPNQSILGYLNAKKVINEMCSMLYSKNGYSTEVRSLTVEDIQDKLDPQFPAPTEKFSYFLSEDVDGFNNINTGSYTPTKDATAGNNGVTVPRFYTWDRGGVVQEVVVNGKTIQYAEPATGNPVYVTKTYKGGSIGENNQPKWEKISETETYGNLFGSTYGWLASPCVVAYSSVAAFNVSLVRSDRLSASLMAYSDGSAISSAHGVRPLVTLSSTVQVEVDSNTSNGTDQKPWILK